MNRFFTVDEAADLLRVKRQTLYKWITQRKIPSISLGGRTLFEERQLAEWLAARQRTAL